MAEEACVPSLPAHTTMPVTRHRDPLAPAAGIAKPGAAGRRTRAAVATAADATVGRLGGPPPRAGPGKRGAKRGPSTVLLDVVAEGTGELGA